MKCEFCSRKLNIQTEGTVCDVCDKSLALSHALLASKRAKKHSEKYKCRCCGKGLPETRRFNCEECVQPSSYSSEPSIDDDFIYFEAA